MKAFVVSSNRRVRFVEEEDQLRLLEVADLRERLEQLGEEPHERRREERSACPARPSSSRQEITPRPSGCGPQQVVDRRTVAHRRARCRRRPPARRAMAQDSRSSDEATPPMPDSSALPASESRKVRTRSQVGEVEERETLLCRRSGRRARGSAPASRSIRGRFARSCGPKSDTVARIGTPGPTPRARVLGRKPGRLELLAELGCPLAGGPDPSPGAAIPERSPSHLPQRPERPARRAAPRAAATCASCPCLSLRRSIHACSRCGAGGERPASVTTLPSRTPLPTSIDAPCRRVCGGNFLPEVAHEPRSLVD